jgi:hypothetical protein
MSVLPTVGPGRMKAEERDALSRFLDENAMTLAADVDRAIAADDRFKHRIGCGHERYRPSVRMTFIARCSARAFCMAASVSPSSTNPGTRMSIAKKSW